MKECELGKCWPGKRITIKGRHYRLLPIRPSLNTADIFSRMVKAVPLRGRSYEA